MFAEVYSKENCRFCTMAKSLLERRGIGFNVLQASDDRQGLIDRVVAASGKEPKTLPQIFLDGEYVGGYTELAAKLDDHREE